MIPGLVKWKALLKPLRRATPIELSHANWLDLDGKAGTVKCSICLQSNIDWCYNCEKPICNEHSIPMIFLILANGCPLIVFNVCVECAKKFGLPEDN